MSFRCSVWPNDNLDRRRGVIVIGGLPFVVITTRRGRIGDKIAAVPVIYRAFQVSPSRGIPIARLYGTSILPCNVIHSFYICYVISIRYCARSEWGRNLWYEFRVCRRVTYRELERIAIRASRYRDYTRNRTAVIDAIWRYINAVAMCVIDNVWPVFIDVVSRDAGGEFVDSAEIIDAVMVLTPHIYSRQTGMPVYCTQERRYIPTREVVERPLDSRELGYIYRCRCPNVHTKEEIQSFKSAVGYQTQLSLLAFMPIEDLSQLYQRSVYSSVSGDENLERAVLESIQYARSNYRCRDATREEVFRELANYIAFVQSARFIRDCRRLCRLRV